MIGVNAGHDAHLSMEYWNAGVHETEIGDVLRDVM
jgi:hypothetical protein